MNTYTNAAVNGKEITKKETDTKSRWCKYLCEVSINGKLRRQWTTYLLDHIKTCNKSGWKIEKATYFVATVDRSAPANTDLYNNR